MTKITSSRDLCGVRFRYHSPSSLCASDVNICAKFENQKLERKLAMSTTLYPGSNRLKLYHHDAYLTS